MTGNETPLAGGNARVLEELRRIPLTQDLGKSRLQRMAEVARIEDYDAGKVLFRQGEPADHPRVVLSGLVSLVVNVPHKGEIVVATVSEGELLGWSALLPNHRWSSSARTARATRCLVFDGPALRELMELDHELGYQILRVAFEIAASRLGDQFLQALDMFGYDRS